MAEAREGRCHFLFGPTVYPPHSIPRERHTHLPQDREETEYHESSGRGQQERAITPTKNYRHLSTPGIFL